MMPSSGKRTWEEKIRRSGFFVGAVFFHLILFLLVATYVVYEIPAPQPDIVFHGGGAPAPKPKVDQPKNTDDSSQSDQLNSLLAAKTNPNHPVSPIGVIGTTGPGWTPPVSVSGTGDGQGPGLPIGLKRKVQVTGPKIPDDRLGKIDIFEHKHRTDANIRDGVPDGTYPVYVASYADGDWYCNIDRDADGNITAGSLPNLSAKIQEWTHGRVQAHVIPKPLSIGGPELLDTAPPFIFFTGHKDFVLTDKEIENLRAYLAEGGAVWGDNALAGKGSRFDVAFKREMKRVVPDLDKNFEPLNLNTELFTKQKFAISKIPEGMNYYTEQIEHLDIDGVPAIIYTPNDYSDLYSMRILPGDKEIMGDHIPLHWTGLPLYTNGVFLHNESVFFRNFTLSSALAVHQLGTNMVTYLITRFDPFLQLPP